MLPSELFQKIYSLFPNFFTSRDIRDTWEELYKMQLSGIPSNHVFAAYKSIMKRWTYPTPPKPGDFIKEIADLFPSKDADPYKPSIYEAPRMTKEEEEAERIYRNKMGLLFKLFGIGYFTKLQPHEAKAFTDQFLLSDWDTCQAYVREQTLHGNYEPPFKKQKYFAEEGQKQIEVTL